jgi:hypothetical protein
MEVHPRHSRHVDCRDIVQKNYKLIIEKYFDDMLQFNEICSV